MSFRFTLGGVECQCDTSDELRSVVLSGAARPATTRRYKPRKAKAAKAAKAAKSAKGSTIRLADQNLEGTIPADAALPLIEGPLSWGKVEKVAKKLGLGDGVDKRELRSALKRRQALAA